MDLMDKAAYIRGLAEGMNFDFETDTGKIIAQLIEALGQTASEMKELTEAYQELNDYVELIDGDLDELQQERDEDDDFDDDDFDLDDALAFDDDDDDEDYDDEESDEEDGAPCAMFLGCICPDCRGIFCVDVDDPDVNRKYVCPHCGDVVQGIAMDIETVPVAEPADEDD